MAAKANQSVAVAKQKTDNKKVRLSRALILPALLFSIILTQIPFLVTIYFSTLNWNLLKPTEIEFVWFKNYFSVFEKGDLLPATLSTVGITSLSVILSVILGLLLAVLLDRKFRGQALARTLLITPFLLMPAAASLIWKYSMFDNNVGILSWVSQTLGMKPIEWTTDLPFMTVVIMLTWQYTPFMMLILLAGLQSQSREVLEAAAVDGAGAWRTFQWITLPHLRQYVEIAVLLGTIMLLQVFDPIAIMTKGTGGTKTLSYLLYERAFVGLNVGEAAAYGVVTVLLTIVVATLALKNLFKVFMDGGQR
ncbi:sugar ABC transporter permease [Rhodoluna sp. KAS3]|uniref:carbohydrate ABC transporter permease n=1 Tax=Rhodoluna sp. KAS3 TaxID=942880 RepID=UPI002231F14B|nr:sugar ABC transporter permease [Rhodoluna sp. KAS3]BDS49586.1 sugar ABC transporter permease [Rhodoluna sp. KAS3]